MKKIIDWFGGSVVKDLLALMMSLGFIVIYVKFIGPLFGLPIPPLELEFWELLKIGIGGYVVGRSAEKIANNITIAKK